MSDPSKKSARDALLGALRRIVRPLLRICLRADVSMAEIRAVLDQAAVQEAESYLLASGKKPSYSSISVITGIERRNVAKLLAIPADDAPPVATTTLHRAVRVLNGWHENPAYVTRQGTPAELPVRGGAISLDGLVRKYAGGTTTFGILDRLVETNTIEVTARDPDGRPARVRPLQATIQPDVNQTRLFDELGVVYSEALEMFDVNLRSTNPIERFRPYTVSATVLKPQLRVLRRQLKERGENLQATLDDTFQPHDLDAKQIAAIAATEPESLYSVRITLFSTIRPAIPNTPPVEWAWRRDRDETPEGEPGTRRKRRRRRPF